MSDYALQVTEAELARYRMMADAAQRSEADLWETAGIVPGATVADVGCGPGAISAVLAARVGESGHVAAVDADEAVLDIAAKALGDTGLANWSTRTGTADDTGLEQSSFDVVMIRHVLAHNGGREGAIVRHAASLLRPGGVLYLVDVDLTTTKLHPSTDDLDDLMQRYVSYHRARGNNIEIGLELSWLLTDADLDVIAYQGRIEIITTVPGMRPPGWAAREAMRAAGVADEDDFARWEAALTEFDGVQPRPLMFPALFVALGRRS